MLSLGSALAYWTTSVLILSTHPTHSTHCPSWPYREPTLAQKHGASQVYSREADHTLLYYPNVTYWTSDDAMTRWDNDLTTGCACHGYPSRDIAPSPWAYHSIAPYSRHYNKSHGDSYGWDADFDCRN